jgi:hypothetical protein
MLARLIQAKALLLLLVFLSAGTSLPSIDALVHHQLDAGTERWQTHVEPAGGCLSHAGHCALGRVAPNSSAGPSESRELQLDETPRTSHHLSPLEAPRSHIQNGVPQPRAPPELFA